MRITPDMIEAAAVAIWRTFTRRNVRPTQPGRGWEQIPPRLQDDYRAEARAALDAALGSARETAA